MTHQLTNFRAGPSLIGTLLAAGTLNSQESTNQPGVVATQLTLLRWLSGFGVGLEGGRPWFDPRCLCGDFSGSSYTSDYIFTPVATLPGTWARMHHKVVGNFGSEADVRSLYFRGFRFNETSDVGACTHGQPVK